MGAKDGYSNDVIFGRNLAKLRDTQSDARLSSDAETSSEVITSPDGTDEMTNSHVISTTDQLTSGVIEDTEMPLTEDTTTVLPSTTADKPSTSRMVSTQSDKSTPKETTSIVTLSASQASTTEDYRTTVARRGPATTRKPQTPSTTGTEIDPCARHNSNLCSSDRLCLTEEASVSGYRCVCKPGHYDVNGTCAESISFIASLKILEIKLSEAKYVDDLKNPDSTYYEKTAGDIETSIGEVFNSSSDYYGTEIVEFSSGSIKVVLLIFFATNTRMSSHVIERTIKDGVQRGGGILVDLTIEKDSVKVKDHNNTACDTPDRNDCSFDADCLDVQGDNFTCQCHSGYEDVSLSKHVRPGRRCVPETKDQVYVLALAVSLGTTAATLSCCLALFLVYVWKSRKLRRYQRRARRPFIVMNDSFLIHGRQSRGSSAGLLRRTSDEGRSEVAANGQIQRQSLQYHRAYPKHHHTDSGKQDGVYNQPHNKHRDSIERKESLDLTSLNGGFVLPYVANGTAGQPLQTNDKNGKYRKNGQLTRKASTSKETRRKTSKSATNGDDEEPNRIAGVYRIPRVHLPPDYIPGFSYHL
ncbi:uncharacterized protein [Ptychodera flava]|uniref:uncharacterized protein n=1 Tax=Ptychodera flava TaxID=63121 RepID=UPI003969E8EE